MKETILTLHTLFKRAILLLIISLSASCSKSVSSSQQEQPPLLHPQPTYQQGIVTIKFSEEFVKKLESNSPKEDFEKYTSISIKSMKRIFPYAGKFEERTRKEGLHRWYDIHFDESISLTKAGADFSSIEGVEIVEYSIAPSLPPYTITKADDVDTPKPTLAEDALFDDPYFSQHWNYINKGETQGFIAGCDINILPVWKGITTGRDDIIVCVVDQGVDYTHEDINPNMWVNEAELNGKPGIDDDHNGYADDIYGYNFVNNSGDIIFGDHGTHVAGTMAAVNNNGKGVCGIAGGDYKKGIPGIKIISAQIVDGTESATVANIAAALKYGADNGAVISQNSWGFTEILDESNLPKSIKDAIDYFVQYAGIDENGYQSGPMRGGIVVFAAGNEERDFSYPAAYKNCLSVASVGADYVRSYFSNYSSPTNNWVDVSATGGDASRKSYIYSCITGNRYGRKQGTSMASPHVAGIAALIIASNNEKGLTPNDVISRIISTSTNIDSYNPTYKGLLGAGLVNAHKAIAGYAPIAPEAIKKVDLSCKRNNITVSFEVPLDLDDEKPYGYTIYYSTKPFENDFDRKKLPEGMDFTRGTIGSLSKGDIAKTTLSELLFDTIYYIAVDTYDKSELFSELSTIFHIKTEANNPPTIKGKIENVISSIGKSYTLNMRDYFFDSDGDKLLYKAISSNGISNFIIEEDELTVKSLYAGLDTISVTATDPEGKSCSLSFASLYRNQNQEIDIYPNPVISTLYLRMGSETDANITITSDTGATIFKGPVHISPFNPASIDMSKVAPGAYNVEIITKNSSFIRKIVKL